MDRAEYGQVMAYLQAGSGGGKTLTDMQLEVYWDFLKDLPADTVRAAAKQALAESQYPTIPPVGVLLKLAGCGASQVGSDSRALVAYTTAARAVQSVGGYDSVEFSDPIVNAVIRGMGGWQKFCDWPVAEVQWRKRDFERQYQSYLQAGVSAELAAPLAGICETSNFGAGLEKFTPEPKLIAVDLPAHRPGLIRGDHPRRVVAHVPNGVAVRVAARLGVSKPSPTEPRKELSDDEIAARKAKLKEQLSERSQAEVVF